jgi:UrcA family protein
MRISNPTFAAAVMLAMLCSVAHADSSADGPSTSVTGRSAVHFGDLNLGDETDAKIMLQRIERAAKTACGGHATSGSITGSVDHYSFEECRAKAIRRAVKQLDAPVVTRIHAEAGREISSIARR